MHEALCPKDIVEILHVSREEGGRGLARIKDCVDASIQGLEEYINKSKRRQVTAANNSNSNIRTNRTKKKTRKQKQEEKQLYGYFKQQTCRIAHQKTWTWLRKGKSQERN